MTKFTHTVLSQEHFEILVEVIMQLLVITALRPNRHFRIIGVTNDKVVMVLQVQETIANNSRLETERNILNI